MRHVILLTAALISLGSIVGRASADWESERDNAQSCYESVKSDPRYAVVNSKLVRKLPSLDQLSNGSIPTDEEAAAIRDRAQRDTKCRELELRAVERYHPFLVSAARIRHFQIDLVHVQLIQRRISYGNANRLMHESFLEYRRREDEYTQARDDAQRRAIADSLNQISQQARTPPPPYPSSGRLTCRWVGPTLYCDPY